MIHDTRSNIALWNQTQQSVEKDVTVIPLTTNQRILSLRWTEKLNLTQKNQLTLQYNVGAEMWHYY